MFVGRAPATEGDTMNRARTTSTALAGAVATALLLGGCGAVTFGESPLLGAVLTSAGGVARLSRHVQSGAGLLAP